MHVLVTFFSFENEFVAQENANCAFQLESCCNMHKSHVTHHLSHAIAHNCNPAMSIQLRTGLIFNHLHLAGTQHYANSPLMISLIINTQLETI